jgi:mono/diheme cytochrome c family protein
MNIELVNRAWVLSCLLIATLSAVPVSALAQQPEGNPLTGRQTADALCAPCHQVGGTRNDGPPSFLDVANMSSTTALSLRAFLRSNHREMPNLMVSETDTNDLIAYILGLNQSPAPRR